MYIKTVDLWNSVTYEKILTGELVLQCGQWVRCGDEGVKSRFVSFCQKSKLLVVAHGGTSVQVTAEFKRKVEALRTRNIRTSVK